MKLSLITLTLLAYSVAATILICQTRLLSIFL